MSLPVVEENRKSRERLASLVDRLSDEDLLRTVEYGWTVAALLAHLAFWDQRVLVLIRRWKSRGVDPSPIDADAVNDSLRPLCLALDPRAAVDLCLASAEAVDAEVETIDQEMVDAALATGTQFRPNRSLHRNGHLDDIERLLSGKGGPEAA